jgi:hypothetical protein
MSLIRSMPVVVGGDLAPALERRSDRETTRVGAHDRSYQADFFGARMGRATTEDAKRHREMPRDETPDRNPDGRVPPGHEKRPDLPFKAVARVQIPMGKTQHRSRSASIKAIPSTPVSSDLAVRLMRHDD